MSTSGYDLTLGRIWASASSDLSQHNQGETRTDDDFVLTGPAAGTPVELLAKLQVNIDKRQPAGPCCASAYVKLVYGGTSVTASSDRYGFTFVIATLPVLVTAGEPFRLHMDAITHGVEYGEGSVFATLVFEGIPAGATLTSCQGFHQDNPVPVLHSTWGALKAAYRSRDTR